MKLDTIRTERQLKPLRVLLYGPPKVGKTTFGASASKPVLLGSEDGADNLDVPRFPSPRSWSDVVGAVSELTDQAHEFRTLVLDTLDWLEPLLNAHVCEQARKPTIESFGYGKGQEAALDEWRRFVAMLDRMRETRSMNVIALAHAQVRTVANPGGEDYDRWETKLGNKKAAALWAEWPEVIGFAAFELRSGEKGKAVATGKRLLHTDSSGGWSAGSRYQLPSPMPLDWTTFKNAVVRAYEGKTK